MDKLNIIFMIKACLNILSFYPRVNELIAKVHAKKNAPEQKKKTKQLSYINGELPSK